MTKRVRTIGLVFVALVAWRWLVFAQAPAAPTNVHVAAALVPPGPVGTVNCGLVTCKYLNAAAGGNGSGSDWSNAYTTLAAAETGAARGNYVFVADGTYNGAVTFNTAESGATYIYFRKATSGDHGTETGWTGTLGDGVAAFAGGWSFTTGYWDMDGRTGGGPGTSPSDWPTSWKTGHGFSVTTSGTGTSNIELGSNGTRTGFRFRHIKLVNGTSPTNTGGPNTGGNVFHAENDQAHAHDVIVEYVYVPNYQGVTFHVKYSNDWTVQYCYFGGSGTGNHANVHRELWSGISNDRWIWRWNYVLNQNNTAVWAFVNGGDDAVDTDIYGNIVDYNSSGEAAGRLIDGTDPTTEPIRNWKLFNNTFVSWDSSAPIIILDGLGAGVGTLTARNNIFAHLVTTVGIGFDGGTYSHNAVYNISRTGTGDVTAAWASALGANTQTFGSSPFVNYATLLGSGETARDLRLSGATSAGSTTGNPAGNTVDMFGHTRGGDGTWDRGALEFGP